MFKRGSRRARLVVVALVCGFLAALAQAQDPPPASPEVWGDYAEVAGRTARASERSYQLRWRWTTPGRELVEEYWQPDGSGIAHTMTLTPGTEPGTLVLQSSALGNKIWNGTLQPDGTVLFIGQGMLKLPYVAGLSEDGAWDVRRVKLDGDRIASVKPADAYNHFLLEGDVAGAVAAARVPDMPPPAAPAGTPAGVVAVSGAVPGDAAPGTSAPAETTVATAAPTEPDPVPRQGPRQLSEADLALLRSRMDRDRVRRSQNLRREQQAAEAQRQQLAWQMEQDRLAAEQADAEYEAEQASSGVNMMSLLGAFERGFNQVAADNQRMRNTLQSGIDRGLAQGAAIHAQRQAEEARREAQSRAADAAHARNVREQEALARQARMAEQRATEAQRVAAQQRVAAEQRVAGQASSGWAASGEAASGRSAAESAGAASTLTDPATCVTAPRTSPNRACGKGYAATITNNCPQPVDARICHMTARGWDCGASWGIQPGADWSHAVCASTGETFLSVRSTGLDQPLASP